MGKYLGSVAHDLYVEVTAAGEVRHLGSSQHHVCPPIELESVVMPMSKSSTKQRGRFELKGKLIAKRSHGIALQPRWNGTGAPPVHQNLPLRGCPALETTHPFHFKMTPAIMLGPSCNHDLGVLLRFASTASSADEAVSAMIDAMGDHEYYCASYSSKDQPHVERSMLTLADGHRAKERNQFA